MRALNHKPLLTLALLGGAALLSLLWQSPAYGGGPLAVGGTFGTPGEPFVWDTTNPIPYSTDQGVLGNQTNQQANDLVRAGFDVWQNTVSTANISFTRAGDLGIDVKGDNFLSFFNTHEDCNGTSAFTNIVVYDSDGSVTDGLLGVGQNQHVLGFAGAVCADATNHFTRGEAVLNGLFIDGQPNPDDPAQGVNKYQEVFVHEFGHLIGLDHSQINVDVLAPTLNRSQDNLFGLPLMFPFLLSSVPARVDQGFPALAPDDEAWLSWLYPSASFTTTYGAITGNIYFSDGTTPLQGANVIARQVDDPATTTVDESRRFAVSVYSGFLYTGNPGQSVTGTNPGSQFGSRDPTLIGFYRIPTKPEDYTVEIESVNSGFTEGSSIGPIGEPFPLPGPAEFFTSPETGDSATDDPSTPINLAEKVTVTANTETSPINIIVNDTPSRFDTYESARLWWREPAPAWVREERPWELQVMG